MLTTLTMIKPITKRLTALIVGAFLFSSASFSQFDVDFLTAGPEDGLAMLQAYVTPYANSFGAGVNGSWYNTAKPHKFGGFDITFGINAGFVPSSANTYDVSKIGLKTFTGTGMAPTISGPDKDGPLITGPTVPGAPSIAPITFRTPPGLNWGIMPVPTLQAGIGLPLGSELKVRYTPKIPIGDGDFSSWGVGLLHSIMQYIPGDKIFPFDISLFGGYNKLQGNAPVDLQPDPNGVLNYSSAYPLPFKDQVLSAVVEAWNAGVIGSINLRIITFYGGLGYTGTSSVVNMKGNYPMPRVNTAVSTTKYVYEDAGVLKGFPALEIKNYSGLRTNLGIRLKFGFFTFHGDYTWAQYSVVSTGLGISFR
jgi:hypothetical protein